MNINAIIEGLIWVARHRKEIASDAECGVHFIRRVEHLLVKHKTTADTILVEADKALTKLASADKKDS